MKFDDPTPYGKAYIKGFRIVFNPYVFKKGKNKGKVKCYYRKGSIYKPVILEQEDITLLEESED